MGTVQTLRKALATKFVKGFPAEVEEALAELEADQAKDETVADFEKAIAGEDVEPDLAKAAKKGKGDDDLPSLTLDGDEDDEDEPEDEPEDKESDEDEPEDDEDLGKSMSFTEQLEAEFDGADPDADESAAAWEAFVKSIDAQFAHQGALGEKLFKGMAVIHKKQVEIEERLGLVPRADNRPASPYLLAEQPLEKSHGAGEAVKLPEPDEILRKSQAATTAQAISPSDHMVVQQLVASGEHADTDEFHAIWAMVLDHEARGGAEDVASA